MPRWPSLSSRSCVREGDNCVEMATAMARQQAAAATHEQATATVASLRQTKLTMAGAERRETEEGNRGGDDERLGHGGLELRRGQGLPPPSCCSTTTPSRSAPAALCRQLAPAPRPSRLSLLPQPCVCASLLPQLTRAARPWQLGALARTGAAAAAREGSEEGDRGGDAEQLGHGSLELQRDKGRRRAGRL